MPNQRMETRTTAIVRRRRCAGDVAILVDSLRTVLMDWIPYILGERKLVLLEADVVGDVIRRDNCDTNGDQWR
jgi:hypothetical protein